MYSGAQGNLQLDASGNLGLGVTPSAWGGNAKGIQITNYGSVSGNSNIGTASLAANAYEYADNGWKRTNATSAGLYQISYTGAHTWSQGVASTANSIITFTQAMTLDASGNLLVGTTSATGLGVGTAPIQSNGTMFSGGSTAGFAFKDRGAASFSLWYKTGGVNYFYTSGAGSNVASINETTGVYTPLSDVNKKKDFEQSFVGLDVVMQLQPKLFRMLSDDNTMPKQLGFIAQDVQPILPQAYVEQKSGDSTFIGLQDRPFIAALVKAIQEQQALITSLTARIEALER